MSWLLVVGFPIDAMGQCPSRALTHNIARRATSADSFLVEHGGMPGYLRVLVVMSEESELVGNSDID